MHYKNSSQHRKRRVTEAKIKTKITKLFSLKTETMLYILFGTCLSSTPTITLS